MLAQKLGITAIGVGLFFQDAQYKAVALILVQVVSLLIISEVKPYTTVRQRDQYRRELLEEDIVVELVLDLDLGPGLLLRLAALLLGLSSL